MNSLVCEIRSRGVVALTVEPDDFRQSILEDSRVAGHFISEREAERFSHKDVIEWVLDGFQILMEEDGKMREVLEDWTIAQIEQWREAGCKTPDELAYAA